MNIRADIPAVVVPMPAPRDEPLAEGFLAPVGGTATALFFDTDAPARGRIAIEAAGRPLAAPMVSTLLPLRSGAWREVALVGRPAEWLLARPVRMSRGGRGAALLDPGWLQSPRVDIAAAFDGLTADGRMRLLRLLLTTGGSLLGRGDARFAAEVRALLAPLGVTPLRADAWCRVGVSTRIVSYRLPADRTGAAETAPVVLATTGGITRLARTPLVVETRVGGGFLHVSLPTRLPAEALLVLPGARPLALELPAEAAGVSVARWLEGRDAATRDWCGRLLDAAAPDDAVAAAVVREARHRHAPAPRLTVAHLSATPAGVLHVFRLADPHGLVRAVRLARGGAVATLDVNGGLAGYCALPRASTLDDGCRLGLVLHSGRVLAAGVRPLPAYDGAAPVAAGADAVAAARTDRERTGRVLRIEDFAAPVEAPALSIIARFPACPDIVATRALLAATEAGGPVEILYHVAEGSEAAGAVLARAAALHGLCHRLLVVTPDLEPAARAVTAIAAARAPAVLLLGAATLPAEAGWLAPWRRLSRRHPMLRAGVEGYDGRPAAESGGAVGFLRASVVDILAAATPCGTGVLAREIAAVLARRGTPEARVGVVFRDYAEPAASAFDAAVDAAVLARLLKRSFSIGCDERQP